MSVIQTRNIQLAAPETPAPEPAPNDLLTQIAASRRRLQDLWTATGRTDAAVLAASIEFDKLLNEYQKQRKSVKSEG